MGGTGGRVVIASDLQSAGLGSNPATGNYICSWRTMTYSKCRFSMMSNHKPVVGNGCPHSALGYDAVPVFRALNGDVKVRGVISLRQKRKTLGFIAVPTRTPVNPPKPPITGV